MNKNIEEKYLKILNEIRKNKVVRTRKSREHELIKKGSLIEMLGLLEKDTSLIVGLLLSYFELNEEEINKKKKIGEIFFEARDKFKKENQNNKK